MKKSTNNERKTFIKEVTLYDELGDHVANDVNLDDVLKLIKHYFPALNATAHYDDYDDYGVEHYIQITGICANIRIEKEYGGMYCPARYLNCSVQTKQFDDKGSKFEYKHRGMVGGIATANHFYSYELKPSLKAITIASDYEAKLLAFLKSHIKYLKADKTIYRRIDNINYPDLSGAYKWGNDITSFDVFVVDDIDFYTENSIRMNAARTFRPPSVIIENPETYT